MTPINREWMSVEETAEYLGYTHQTVRKWIKDGTLQASQITARGKIRISAVNIEKMLENNRKK